MLSVLGAATASSTQPGTEKVPLHGVKKRNSGSKPGQGEPCRQVESCGQAPPPRLRSSLPRDSFYPNHKAEPRAGGASPLF